MTGEYEPKSNIEERVLVRLGYGHCLDIPLEEGAPTIGRHFLDAYGDSPKRQDTEDLLWGFLEMPEDDPDFEPMKSYINRFIEPFFGSPRVDKMHRDEVG